MAKALSGHLRDLDQGPINLQDQPAPPHSGTTHLEQLFEEQITTGKDILASWLLQPRKLSGQPAEYLQYQLGSFMWQTDGSVYVPENIVGATRLERASTLGKIDFGAADASFEDMV